MNTVLDVSSGYVAQAGYLCVLPCVVWWFGVKLKQRYAFEFFVADGHVARTVTFSTGDTAILLSADQATG